MNQKSTPNHLAEEKSPYLLQHAYNPVEWYPWGDEAFQEAKASDRPIFLSIGYATCHWCHVMEKESFENEDIAKIMNKVFVNIKLDREEHPEIDKLYMEFAQALMSTGGGWPLNVILTPDLKPFFAATYLPPRSMRGHAGLIEIAEEIHRIWNSEQRAVLFEQADKVVELFQKSVCIRGDRVPDDIDLENAIEILFELADPVNGGLKGAPKFPVGYLNSLFLTRARLKNDSRALYFVEITLDKIASGGIYDHIGGGFSRYATDEKWRIPHFEKMLYDNAILVSTYVDAWRCTKKDLYRTVVEETLSYVKRELSSPEGAFYSAQDADSEGQEGKFYTWTRTEIENVLSPEDASFFCEYYNVSLEGNFDGRNVLFYEDAIEDFAAKQAISEEEARSILKQCKEKLFAFRESREKPFTDDKILTSWNALMAHAFLEAGLAFQNHEYVKMALDAVLFIQKHLSKEDFLLKRYRENEARFTGGLNEYAYMIKVLIRLFEAGEGSQWLSWALDLTRKLEKDFKEEGGAFYSTEEAEDIIVRHCDFYDGAEPSGNAVHAENLLKLYQITQNPLYLLQAEEIFKAAKVFMENYPPGAAYHFKSLYRYADNHCKTIVIALNEQEEGRQQIFDLIFSQYYPHTVVVWKKANDKVLSDLLPNLQDKVSINGMTAMYICTQDSCLEPETSIEKMQEKLLKL
ncbi:MAG: thioredoxin domain-containing protein [Simkaniaceae bacterium]